MRLLRIPLPAAFLALTLTSAAFASVVGSVRGVIHDPQHRPVQNAMVMLKAKSSDWSTTANSDANGNFAFNAVPLGEYTVTVAGVGFEQAQQDVVVISGTQPVLAFRAQRCRRQRDDQRLRHSRSSRPPIRPLQPQLVDRLDIARTPGAARTNSLAMITDFVPGAYVTHDQLHIRGGHQTSWLVDGVPVPNTNIAYQHRPAVRSQGYRLSRSQPRQLRRRTRRPHLRRLQRRAAHRIRAQPPGRTRAQRRKFLPDQRPVQLRQPHRALRLLRQRERQPQQSRHSDAHSASRSRRRQRLRRLRLTHLQRRSLEPASPRDLAAQGLLPDSLRSRLQRSGKFAV